MFFLKSWEKSGRRVERVWSPGATSPLRPMKLGAPGMREWGIVLSSDSQFGMNLFKFICSPLFASEAVPLQPFVRIARVSIPRRKSPCLIFHSEVAQATLKITDMIYNRSSDSITPSLLFQRSKTAPCEAAEESRNGKSELDSQQRSSAGFRLQRWDYVIPGNPSISMQKRWRPGGAEWQPLTLHLSS